MDSGEGRSLRLERETLRDLTPTNADAATVRGGDDRSTLGSKEGCEPPMYQALKAFLGQTALTLGASGTVKITPLEQGGHEISFAIEPTPEMREIQVQVLRQLGG